MLKIISSIILSTSTVLLLGGGIYFSVKLCFPQFKWKKIIKGLNSENKSSLIMSLAARIGVGSMAGVSLAIYIGGPGTVFWIVITSLITSVNTYCESYLALKYQEKEKSIYKGGPSYYIEKGLNNRKLAIIFSILLIISYTFGFITIQGNTITKSINNLYNINSFFIALVLSIICFISISKGIKSITNISNKIIPFMGILYLIISTYIIIKNIHIMPSIITTIIKSAFSFKSFNSGFITSFFIGMQRGIFSTESGLGTSAIATSMNRTNNRIETSLMQILGVYFTVFIVCTSTAIIILTSNYKTLIINNGIELTQYALNYHLGSYGNNILLIIVVLLAYSTIIAGYYYSECSLVYLLGNIKKYKAFILKLLTVIILFIGSIINTSIIWRFIDILIEILAIINMYSLLKLRNTIIIDYKKSK